jgi:hypothetical protein
MQLAVLRPRPATRVPDRPQPAGGAGRPSLAAAGIGVALCAALGLAPSLSPGCCITVEPQQRESYLTGWVSIAEQARPAAGCLDFAISADLLDPGPHQHLRAL